MEISQRLYEVQDIAVRSGSLVPRLLPSFLSHTVQKTVSVCNKKLGRSLETRLRSGIASCSSACYNFAHGIADLHGEF